MKSTYSFENKSDYLYMKLSGEFDERDYSSFIEIMSIKCEEVNMEKVLIEALSVDFIKLSDMSRLFLGDELAKMTRGRLKIAIVIPHNYITKFLENVAFNRGASVFVIDTVEDAKRWLKEY